MDQKLFLYARKSTDVEDKQVLSIEAQLSELRTFAKEQGIVIVQELVEKQSAKMPGRLIFNSMLDRIEKGEASGILSWHPDRLARNSVDGGKIIYMVDTGTIVALKFPSFWFENTPQGKFMLNMAFVQSKYYIDSLSENTKRGCRQKIRQGGYPGLAPIGYLNDVRIKTIVIDKKRSVVVRKAFELYLKGDSRLEDIANFLRENGIATSTGKPRHRDQITVMLSNPFYYGHFRYAGEVYEGKHAPIITKQLFDEVQEVLADRGKVQQHLTNQPQPFCGLLRCNSCSMMITAEHRIKKQKNGNVHQYTYYHCSKKSKNITCLEPCIRAEELDKQLSSLLASFALPKEWAEVLRVMFEKDTKEAGRSGAALVQETKDAALEIQRKLQRLLDSYLKQDIEREVYLKKKAELMGTKKSLEEKNIKFERDQNGWVEPMRKWIKDAENLTKIAQDDDLGAKKVVAKEIFGSNLLLSNKTVTWGEEKNGEPIEKNQWTAMLAAHRNLEKIPVSCVLVRGEGFEPSTSCV